MSHSILPCLSLSLYTTTHSGEAHKFQAETKQLLDIVTNSLYTDKDVFIRELISNASDALEKARHLQVTGASLADPSKPFEIRITTDEKTNSITFEDSGELRLLFFPSLFSY